MYTYREYPNHPSQPKPSEPARERNEIKGKKAKEEVTKDGREEGKRAHIEEKPRKFTRIAIQGCERQSLKAPWDRAEIRIRGGYRAITFAPVRPAPVWGRKKRDLRW
jgi:hypothetical protein